MQGAPAVEPLRQKVFLTMALFQVSLSAANYRAPLIAKATHSRCAADLEN